MSKTGVLFIFMALAGTLLSGVLHASSLDCPGGIVSAGDYRMDLLKKCGEPSSTESRQEELVERPVLGVKRKSIVTVEEWTYDFGPGRFTRIVTLKNGVIDHIETGGYGGNARSPSSECSEQSLSLGERTSDVSAKCGEPSWKDTRREDESRRLENGLVGKTSVTIEEWTYDLGPNRFVRILTFRNGVLTDIRTGGYGYELRRKEENKAP